MGKYLYTIKNETDKVIMLGVDRKYLISKKIISGNHFDTFGYETFINFKRCRDILLTFRGLKLKNDKPIIFRMKKDKNYSEEKYRKFYKYFKREMRKRKLW